MTGGSCGGGSGTVSTTDLVTTRSGELKLPVMMLFKTVFMLFVTSALAALMASSVLSSPPDEGEAGDIMLSSISNDSEACLFLRPVEPSRTMLAILIRLASIPSKAAMFPTGSTSKKSALLTDPPNLKTTTGCWMTSMIPSLAPLMAMY